MYKIDKIDYDIVTFLMEDGRMSASEIARRLGDVTERTIRYRIERMVEEGLMRISAVVNPQALGFDTIADVFVEVESDLIADVAEKVARFDNVSYVAYSIGETDVSVQVVAKDTADVYRFVTEVIRRIPGVRKTTTSIVPSIVKDVYQWPIPASLLADVGE
ncbi:MAG: Lrp/AsnC family transcriptional regulator [Chloroflexi bacterium]|nr:Lrp/AsnC family transcriptional regulator [Chloroflexota bacterium]